MINTFSFLVTGVSQGGIGEAICHRLVDEALGRKEWPWVTITATRADLGLKEVARCLEERGATVLPIEGDLRNTQFSSDLVRKAGDFAGRLDLVVSNAGRARAGILLSLTEDDWDHALDLHVRAAWHLARAAYPHLAESKGCFLATSSIAGMLPRPGNGAYSIAKSALIMLCRQLALEWAPDVRVNVVSPGFISTARSPKSDWKAAPLGRPGTVDEVAQAISFLAKATYVTGQNIVVDGGLIHSALDNE